MLTTPDTGLAHSIGPLPNNWAKAVQVHTVSSTSWAQQVYMSQPQLWLGMHTPRGMSAFSGTSTAGNSSAASKLAGSQDSGAHNLKVHTVSRCVHAYIPATGLMLCHCIHWYTKRARTQDTRKHIAPVPALVCCHQPQTDPHLMVCSIVRLGVLSQMFQ